MDEVADAASPQDTSIIQNSRRVIGPTVRYRPALSLAEFRVLSLRSTGNANLRPLAGLSLVGYRDHIVWDM